LRLYNFILQELLPFSFLLHRFSLTSTQSSLNYFIIIIIIILIFIAIVIVIIIIKVVFFCNICIGYFTNPAGKPRPGTCPALSPPSEFCPSDFDECKFDWDCDGKTKKCCSNGCYRVCAEPAVGAIMGKEARELVTQRAVLSKITQLIKKRFLLWKKVPSLRFFFSSIKEK